MNRRHFLQTTTAAIAGAALPASAATTTRIIDTHVHFFDPSRNQGVPWPGKNTPLYRTVLPDDWKKVASPQGIDSVLVVEASQWVEDNQWILDLAAKEKCIVGFIGNLDPADANFSANLKQFAANPLFRGIRWRDTLVQVDSSKEAVRRGAKDLADHGLVLELNGKPPMLIEAAKIAKDLPALRIMIDHVAGAGDAAHLSEQWREAMILAAERPNIFLKVSGMIEQTDLSAKQHGSAPRETDYYRPILDHCWECFSENRLVYGSNWPVCEKGGAYSDQFKIASEYFHAKGREAADKYFFKNSREVYRWTERV
jgi:predicted TIM-barrel fold metal-dependent hydrolase